jgi:hypothetical protein
MMQLLARLNLIQIWKINKIQSIQHFLGLLDTIAHPWSILPHLIALKNAVLLWVITLIDRDRSVMF